MEKKDALTDLVEFVQGTVSTGSAGSGQVVNSQGEIITLGHPGKESVSPRSKSVPLELDVREFQEKVSTRVQKKLLSLIGTAKTRVIGARIKES
ncbi:MAG TPA: hypothetical protein VHC20_00170 [Candidatus Paceibacterota bacterium]|nr:hypothetical protein [Candidatus Paceibacterota bacterium]